MSTIVGIDCDGGIVIAGDRTVVRDGQVVSRSRSRVFEFDGFGAAAVGDDTDAFGRTLDAELRRYRLEHETVHLDPVARIAARVAEEAGVDAIVGGRDEDGVAHLRVVDRDGGVLEESFAAVGSGAALALGRLEAEALDVDLDAATALARAVFDAVADRDPETGAEIDTYTLADAD